MPKNKKKKNTSLLVTPLYCTFTRVKNIIDILCLCLEILVFVLPYKEVEQVNSSISRALTNQRPKVIKSNRGQLRYTKVGKGVECRCFKYSVAHLEQLQ